MTLSPTDAAYLAGLMDSDGSFQIFRASGEYKVIQICVQNTSKAMIEWICEKTDIAIYKIPRKYHTDGRKEKPSWRWQIGNREKAEQIIIQIKPYLVAKSFEADILLEFIRKWNEPETRKACYDLIKEAHAWKKEEGW